jgi:hypothetical protein
MRVRILLQIATDDGLAGEIEELASLTKGTDRPEELGLSLAESKTLLAAVQRRIVEAQAEIWIEPHRCCAACCQRLRSKGSYPIVFHTRPGAALSRDALGVACALRRSRPIAG